MLTISLTLEENLAKTLQSLKNLQIGFAEIGDNFAIFFKQLCTLLRTSLELMLQSRWCCPLLAYLDHFHQSLSKYSKAFWEIFENLHLWPRIVHYYIIDGIYKISRLGHIVWWTPRIAVAVPCRLTVWLLPVRLRSVSYLWL